MSIVLKLRLILLAVTGAGIGGLATAAWIADSWVHRDSLNQRMSSTLSSVAEPSHAALMARQDLTDISPAGTLVEQLLTAMVRDPELDSIRLTAADGSLVASAGAPTSGNPGLRLQLPVLDQGQVLGQITVQGNSSVLEQRQRQLLLITGTTLAIALALALLVAMRTGKLLHEPLQQLTRLMTRVGQNKDYQVRAKANSSDEFGGLADNFNSMLDQVEARDSTLEALVSQRTRELAAANNALQQRVQEATRAREEALAAAAAKSSFLASMSHEIRTPMNGVLGMLDMLRDTSLNDDQRSTLDTACTSAEGLLHVINEILDLSKIEAGHLELELLPTRVGELVEDVVAVLFPQADAKTVDLACLVAPELYNELSTDPNRLRQVLLNLAGNAVKFTSTGSVIIQAELQQRANGETLLELAVRDTGIGISVDAQARLFEPFSQAEESTSRRFGGTGLGLTISRQIVEAMAGTIDVSSTPGEGSCFSVRIPVANPAAGPLRLVPEHLARALVVTSAPAMGQALRQHLVSLGMDPEVVPPPADAADLVRRHQGRARPVELLLLDRDALDAKTADTLIQGLQEQGRDSSLPALRVLGIARKSNDADLLRPLRRHQLMHALGRSGHQPGNASTSAQGAGSSTAAASDRSTPPDYSSQKVLLVEDNPVNQKVAKAVLGKFGIQPDLAETGTEAVAAASTRAYDLVLMDCQLPELDGFAATGLIRQHEASTGQGSSIIIALTANAMSGDAEHCLAAGMDAYLAKPFRVADMAKVLGQWIDPGEAPAAAET